MIPELLQFTQDDEGGWHFASDSQPLKTIVDPAIGVLDCINCGDGVVTIHLDGKTVIYDRIAFGPHGEWICALRINGQLSA